MLMPRRYPQKPAAVRARVSEPPFAAAIYVTASQVDFAPRRSCQLARRSLAGEVFRGHHTTGKRPHGRLRTVLGAELGEHVPDVCLDGLVADVERGGDVPVRLAERQLSQHIELAWSQVVADIGAQYSVADRRIDERPPARDRPYRGEQRLRFGVFANVASRSGRAGRPSSALHQWTR